VESFTGGNPLEEFNSFISDMELHDIPLMRRKFTWVRPNGYVKSKLDKFLISSQWEAC